MEVCESRMGDSRDLGVIELPLDRWKGLGEAKTQKFGFENIV